MPEDMHLYVPVDQVASALGLNSGGTADAAHIERATEAASRAVEQFCRGRRFWLDPEPVERSFTARSGDVLDLRPELTELVEVIVNGQTWTRGEDFELTPLNAPLDGQPYLRAVTIGRRRWPTSTGAVRITGRFGWPQIPAEVEQATLLVASRLTKRKDAPFGIASMPSWEGIGMRLLERFDADGAVLLYPYKLPAAIA